MRSVFIDGEAGTTGLRIAERLSALPVRVRSIDPARRKDRDARLDAMRDVDLVVLCLPDAASIEAASMVAEIARAGGRAPKLLDASTAFRTHPDWVFGFPELEEGQGLRIAEAPLVSNPGCYSTGAIALLAPLVRDGILPRDHPVAINAVSGYSGGGRSMIEAHERDGGPAHWLYGLELHHKHVPEIEMHARLARRPIFVPSVGHFPQGMIVSIPLFLDLLPGRLTPAMVRACLRRAYAGSAAITVPDEASTATGTAPAGLDAAALAGTDRLELRVHGGDAQPHALLTASLDNLGKGAAGAAIQNIRLMLALD